VARLDSSVRHRGGVEQAYGDGDGGEKYRWREFTLFDVDQARRQRADGRTGKPLRDRRDRIPDDVNRAAVIRP
jgi:hypothetical protein